MYDYIGPEQSMFHTLGNGKSEEGKDLNYASNDH